MAIRSLGILRSSRHVENVMGRRFGKQAVWRGIQLGRWMRLWALDPLHDALIRDRKLS